ncbi:putative toxin-antitoxin system toxin component, PIN family [Rhizobium sp.]
MFDTSLMVTAIRSPAGASRRLLTAALQRKLTLVVSVPLMIEYEAVMTRPEHLEASNMTVEHVEKLLDSVTAVAERVRVAFRWRPVLHDPNDDMVLEAAVNGQARIISTFNRSDFGNAALFGIEILSPREAWLRLESET